MKFKLIDCRYHFGLRDEFFHLILGRSIKSKKVWEKKNTPEFWWSVCIFLPEFWWYLYYCYILLHLFLPVTHRGRNSVPSWISSKWLGCGLTLRYFAPFQPGSGHRPYRLVPMVAILEHPWFKYIQIIWIWSSPLCYPCNDPNKGRSLSH